MMVLDKMLSCSRGFKTSLIFLYCFLAIVLFWHYQNRDYSILPNKVFRGILEDYNSSSENTSVFRQPSYDVYHGYCIYYNVFTPRIREYDRISQILHLSSNLLDERLVEQALNWKAPLSVAILLHDISEYPCILNKLNSYLADYPEISRYLSVHIVYSQLWTDNCNISSVIHCVEHGEANTRQIANYPANVVRNIARMYAPSKYILIADLEHLFSYNFETHVRQIADEILTVDPKRLLVYRIFEVEENITELPKNKSDLYKLYKNKQAVVFHDKFYKGAHGIEGLDKWFSSINDTDGISAENYQYKSASWEPQFVSLSDIPMHDELFPFLIRDNTALRWELCRAGYKLDILSDHFMFHRGIKTEAAGVQSKKIQTLNAGRFNRALTIFTKRMDAIYPDTRESCPEFHAK